MEIFLDCIYSTGIPCYDQEQGVGCGVCGRCGRIIYTFFPNFKFLNTDFMYAISYDSVILPDVFLRYRLSLDYSLFYLK